MKRGGPNHPMTLALMQALGCSRPGAVGIIECLWHFSRAYAPKGNVGKWTDEDIAHGIKWEGDPSTLIDALVSAGWLERHPTLRLVFSTKALRLMGEGGDSRTNHALRWARMKKAGGQIGRWLREFIFNRDGRRCVLCGAVVKLTIDHIIPISKDGTNEEENLRTLCRKCNSKKGDRV